MSPGTFSVYFTCIQLILLVDFPRVHSQPTANMFEMMDHARRYVESLPSFIFPTYMQATCGVPNAVPELPQSTLVDPYLVTRMQGHIRWRCGQTWQKNLDGG
ncbi:hypothetical protein B0H14DRAFT_2773841, partial [Mycena olivaceomarginata]